MSDLSAQIGQLLSDPQTMEQIKALSGLLGLPDDTPPLPPKPAPPSGMGDVSDFLPAAMRFMPLLSALKEDDDTIRLLYAVKPFLSEERREKLDKAIKLLRVIRLIPLLRENDLLSLF